MGNRYRSTVSSKPPVEENVDRGVVADGGEGQVSLREIEEGVEAAKDYISEDDPFYNGNQPTEPFEVLGDEWDGVNGDSMGQPDIDRLVKEIEAGEIDSFDDIKGFELENGELELSADEQETLLEEMDELAGRSVGSRNTIASTVNKLQAAANGEEVSLDAAETELVANAKYAGESVSEISGKEFGTWTKSRGDNAEAIRETFESNGEVAVYETGNPEAYDFQGHVRELESNGELPEGVDADELCEKINQINTKAQTGVDGLDGEFERNDITQVRVFDDKESLDAYLNGNENRATDVRKVNNGDSPYGNTPTKERALTNEELEFVAKQTVVDRDDLDGKKKITDAIAEKLGYKTGESNSFHGEVEMAEQVLRVGSISDGDSSFTKSNEIGGDGIITSDGVADCKIPEKEMRAMVVKKSDGVVEDVAVMDPSKLSHTEHSDKFAWSPTKNVEEARKESTSEGSFGVVGEDSFAEEHGVASGDTAHLSDVSSKSDLDKAPRDDVLSANEIAERVGDKMNLEDGGKMMYKHSNKNEYGDVFENEVIQALYGQQIKTLDSEDYEFPDIPREAIEVKIYDEEAGQISVGARHPNSDRRVEGTDEVVESTGKDGKVNYTGAEGEVGLTPDTTRYVVARNDHSAVGRSDMSKENVREVVDRQGLSKDQVYNRDLSDDQIDSMSEDEFREELTNEFVERCGRVKSGVVISGREIGGGDNGAVNPSSSHEYEVPEEEL